MRYFVSNNSLPEPQDAVPVLPLPMPPGTSADPLVTKGTAGSMSPLWVLTEGGMGPVPLTTLHLLETAPTLA